MTDDKRKTRLVITGRGGGGGGTQVQADWDQSDNTQPDFIKNKPTIPAAQVQSDWNESDNTSKAYIANKPTILTQWFGTQAEYDLIDPKDPNVIYNIEGNDVDWSEISNKPTIPSNTETLTFTLADSTTRTITFYTT